jgi:hypothetical protein
LSAPEAQNKGIKINHVGIFRGFNKDGSIKVFDQWDPANNGNGIDSDDGVLDTRDKPDAKEWFVVKAREECDPKPSESSVRPSK